MMGIDEKNGSETSYIIGAAIAALGELSFPLAFGLNLQPYQRLEQALFSMAAVIAGFLVAFFA